MTIWVATFLFILFGPAAALYCSARCSSPNSASASASLSTRRAACSRRRMRRSPTSFLTGSTIATRRWDPFYATLHQVVTKPSQATFNSRGFLMCGKAFVGRQLVPPVDTYIRDELRDAGGRAPACAISSPTSRRSTRKRRACTGHQPPHLLARHPAEEPSVWPLTLAEFEARLDDPEGPLVLAKHSLLPGLRLYPRPSDRSGPVPFGRGGRGAAGAHPLRGAAARLRPPGGSTGGSPQEARRADLGRAPPRTRSRRKSRSASRKSSSL